MAYDEHLVGRADIERIERFGERSWTSSPSEPSVSTRKARS